MAELRSHADLEEALKTVERDKQGIIVLSPYGFTIREYDGKKYLVALTKEEAQQLLREDGIAVKDGLGSCVTPSGNGFCVQGSCTEQCDLVFMGKGFVCVCSYP
jgi:hypothetical protein